MRVMMNQQFADLDGVVVEDDKKRPFTLRVASMNALLINTEEDRSISGEEKLARWELALKIKNSEEPVLLTAEEISLVKRLLARTYGTLIVGQAYKLFEEKDEKAAVPAN